MHRRGLICSSPTCIAREDSCVTSVKACSHSPPAAASCDPLMALCAPEHDSDTSHDSTQGIEAVVLCRDREQVAKARASGAKVVALDSKFLGIDASIELADRCVPFVRLIRALTIRPLSALSRIL